MTTGALVIKNTSKWCLVKGDILKCDGCGDVYNLRTQKVVNDRCLLGNFYKHVTDVTAYELEKGFRL